MEKKNKKLTYARIKNSRAFKILYDGGVLYFALAFLIPAAIMYGAFREQSIHMLGFFDGKLKSDGQNQMLVVDLWHQYYPFFRVVRDKLLNGGSFLYSWQNGMGTNFLSLISYYAASPLNWLSVFFDDEHTRDALTYILIAKIDLRAHFLAAFCGILSSAGISRSWLFRLCLPFAAMFLAITGTSCGSIPWHYSPL